MSIRPPRTLAISAPGVDRSALAEWLGVLRRHAVEAVQLRCKGRSDRAVMMMAQHARELLGREVSLLINGRPDICLLAGGDGVHLPAAGLPVQAARDVLGSGALVGRSTHSVEEVRAAADEGADYVTFGPVYSTPGKEIYGPPQGLAMLEEVVRLGIPVLALGGITTIERIRCCVAAGAWGIAGIRLFADSGLAAECVATLEELSGQ